jgi:hypothetical protein
MLIFAFILLIFANLVNHSKGFKQEVKITFLFIVYVCLILIFAFRSSNVPDTQFYIDSYYNLPRSAKFEYIYTSITQIARSLGLSFSVFLLLYQIILFSLWFYATGKYIKDVHLAFLIFTGFMGNLYFGIIIRAAMGLCLCYIALVYLFNQRTFRGFIVYFAIVTVAVFFQKSMIVFYILPLYIFKKINNVVLLSILIFSILIPLIDVQLIIAKILEAYIKFFSSEKLLSYTRVHANFNAHGLYSMTMIKYWIMACIFLYLRPKVISKADIYNLFLNLYISGVFLITLTFFIAAGNRLAFIFLFFEFSLVLLLYENSTIPKKIVFIGSIALSVLNYLNLISANPSMLSY